MSAPTEWNGINLAENRSRMERGELYCAFVPDLIADRRRASQACAQYNRDASHVSRREQVELLKKCVPTLPELPPKKENEDEDEAQLGDFPWFEPPFKADYGDRVVLGKGVYTNFGFIALDTCTITLGDRCLFGPNVHLYAATHPLDPAVRQGTTGPELGGPIDIGADCWFGGNVTVLPNVKIGRGVTVGAGSVVTKSVPPFVVVVGNPARIVRKIESDWATEYFKEHPEEEWFPPSKEEVKAK
ncbi:acetyltransferase [Sporobolomyces koalae]|uniref:acetyltransferase n=1 Tax=Sporobolomyces koalae TaxID=500713 RepID=UPI003172370B